MKKREIGFLCLIMFSLHEVLYQFVRLQVSLNEVLFFLKEEIWCQSNCTVQMVHQSQQRLWTTTMALTQLPLPPFPGVITKLPYTHVVNLFKAIPLIFRHVYFVSSSHDLANQLVVRIYQSLDEDGKAERHISWKKALVFSLHKERWLLCISLRSCCQ